MRGLARSRSGLDSPYLLAIRTRCEIEETGDGLQSTVDNDAEIDAAGQCRALFGTEFPGEADAV